MIWVSRAASPFQPKSTLSGTKIVVVACGSERKETCSSVVHVGKVANQLLLLCRTEVGFVGRRRERMCSESATTAVLRWLAACAWDGKARERGDVWAL